jgi:hypothetical protein
MNMLLPFMICGLVTSLAAGVSGAAETPLGFTPAGNGEFTFDTGVLRGKVRAGGKSLGLTSVFYMPSGKRLDRSNGLFSHYRVFTKGVRYGVGAWDWPSEPKLGQNGALEIRWAAAAGRPFELRANYRWRDPATLDLETIVKAGGDLAGFESFVASYFEGFTNAAVFVAQSPENNSQPGFLPARKSYADWLMFPREPGVVPLIKDGRWKLEPNPVDWTIMPVMAKPIALRRNPASGLTAVLMSPASDCFAIACPHQAEGHGSVYFSMFGRDIRAGETLRGRTRLVFASSPTEQEIFKLYENYLAEVQKRQ